MKGRGWPAADEIDEVLLVSRLRRFGHGCGGGEGPVLIDGKVVDAHEETTREVAEGLKLSESEVDS